MGFEEAEIIYLYGNIPLSFSFLRWILPARIVLTKRDGEKTLSKILRLNSDKKKNLIGLLLTARNSLETLSTLFFRTKEIFFINEIGKLFGNRVQLDANKNEQRDISVKRVFSPI